MSRLAALVALLVVLAACGRPASPAAGMPATVIAAPDWVAPTCPVPQPDELVMGEPGQQHGIPTTFEPAWLLRCSINTEHIAGQGLWTTLATERADLSASTAASLVGDLRKPSDSPATTGCPGSLSAQAMIVPYFALVDAHGKAVLPGLPLDECGRPQGDLLTLLAQLRFHTLSTVPVRQQKSEAALATGCAPEFKNLFVRGGSAQPGSAAGPWPTPVTSLRLCVYQATGEFTAGHAVSPTALSGLLSSLESAPPARPCVADDTRFAVLLDPDNRWAAVELDGCQRMLSSDGVLSQLDQATIDLITRSP